MPPPKDVSCYSLALIIDHALGRGVPTERLLDGVREPLSLLTNPMEWIDSAVWARVAANVEAALGGGPEVMVEVGRQVTLHEVGNFQLLFMRVIPLPLLLAGIEQHVRRYVARNMTVTVHRLGRRRLEVVITPTRRETYSIQTCRFNRGCILGLLELRGYRNPRVAEKQCAPGEGAAACRLELTWAPSFTLGRKLLHTRAASEQLERSHAEMQRQYSFLAALLDTMPNPVFYKSLDGRYISGNEAFCALVGVPREQLAGKTVADAIPDDRARLHQEFDRKLIDGEGPQMYEAMTLHADGVLRESLFYKGLFNGPDGRSAGIVGTVIDISAERRAQRQRSELEAQLRQAQKMEALGTLAGGIAHDFNNILAAIIGYTELAQHKAQGQQSLSDDLGRIMAAAERAGGLVRQILTFSRKGETDLGPVHLNQLVRHTVELLRASIPRMVEMDLRLQPNLPPLLGDRSQLEQVLMNLMINSADAMPDGGRLTITTALAELAQAEADGMLELEPGRYLRLEVADTGHGMDAGTLKQAFDPFFTTKEVGRGTGLGLSTVYGVAKAHGGSVEAHSELGQGARMVVWLPLRESPCVARPPAGPPEAEAHGANGRTVLLVDDEKALRQVGHSLLTAAGFQVLCAASGEEALALQREHGAVIDAVVLDLSMPGMGGLRCWEGLRRADPGIPVIIASGYALDGGPDDALIAQAAALLPKPYRGAELVRTLNEVLDDAGKA